MKIRWQRRGIRFLKAVHRYHAVIFATPAPYQYWAWAVWLPGRLKCGIEYSLAAAREKATAEIEEVLRAEGVE